MSRSNPVFVYQERESRAWFVDDSELVPESEWDDWEPKEFPSWSEAYNFAYTLARVRNVVADVIGGMV